MNREQAEPLVRQCIDHVAAVDAQYEALATIIGAHLDSPLFEAQTNALDGYVRAVETLVGDEFNFISWYIWENDFGGKEMSAKGCAACPIVEVGTVDDLLCVMFPDEERG